MRGDAVTAERRMLLDRLIRLLAIQRGYGEEDALPDGVRASLAAIAWRAYEGWAARRLASEAEAPGGADRLIAELDALCGLIADLAEPNNGG